MPSSFQRPSWPNGATCAVTLTFDNFGESFDLLRHGHAGGANADGVYAPRRGVERVLDLLARYSIPATFFVEGWNARKYAPLAREIVEQGHEVGAHGWMHEPWSELNEAFERELIERTTDTLAGVLGSAPQGWRSPSGLTTTKTLGFLRDAGYHYDSSFGDDDVPYLLRTGAGAETEIVELPWSWSLDDAPYYAHPGTIRRPSEVVQLWIEEFDAAYELTGNFMLVCHPRYSGRPARIRALEKLIQHIRAHEGVWFTRCSDLATVAQTWADIPHHPFPEQMHDDEVTSPT
ncbi:MAG TPA: polysaccharide deacetylase [Nitrolancea sp.]|nr:polysaccharide deacetylase [Nitrolancea sp.]